MRENVIVAYRGAKYELGQWPHGYGIWSVADEGPLPLEWWDPTPDGWSAAWYRFAAIETPGTIAPAGQPGGTPAGAVSTAVADTVPAGAAAGADSAAGPATQAAPGDTTGTPAPAPQPAPGDTTGTPAASADTAASSADFAAAAAAAAADPAAASPRPAPFFGPSSGPFPGHSRAAAANAARAPSDPGNTAALSPRTSRVAAGLLAVGIALGIAGLFPAYLTGNSLASQADNLWPHLMYLAGWAGSAVLIFRSGRLQRTGALIGTGASVVTLGLFLADAGYAIAGGASVMGAGLVLSLLGWLACAAGSVVAFGRWPAGWPRRPLGPDAGVVAALVVAALAVAITFAPAWDKVSLPTGTGASLSETLGNAFKNPGAVIAGDVVVMLALVAVVAVAALWRPARMGWALIAGAMIPMVAQVVSALVQLSEPMTAAQLVGPAGAAQLGIPTSQQAQTSFTPAFWLYCLFVLVLLVACAWLAFGHDEQVSATGGYGYGSPAGYGTSHPAAMSGGWPATPAGYPAPHAPSTPGTAAGSGAPPHADASGPAGS